MAFELSSNIYQYNLTSAAKGLDFEKELMQKDSEIILDEK